MAKKDFRQDTEDIFGLDQPPVKKAEPKAAPAKAVATPAKAAKPAAAPKAKAAPAEKLTLKSYYLTPKLYKALKLRSVMSDKPEDKDLSAIVRAALSEYLKDELKQV